jgi:AbrB family looped-hinge helix DNA binding protein
MKNVKVKKNRKLSPLIKVMRHGQITIPKELRNVFEIQEGDLVEVTLNESGIFIKPKLVVDKSINKNKFAEMVDDLRSSVKKVKPAKLDKAIKEAVENAKG